jgi:hypothetical protein
MFGGSVLRNDPVVIMLKNLYSASLYPGEPLQDEDEALHHPMSLCESTMIP